MTEPRARPALSDDQMRDADLFYTVEEVARLTDREPSVIRHFIRTRVLPAVVSTTGPRMYLIRPSDVYLILGKTRRPKTKKHYTEVTWAPLT